MRSLLGYVEPIKPLQRMLIVIVIADIMLPIYWNACATHTVRLAQKALLARAVSNSIAIFVRLVWGVVTEKQPPANPIVRTIRLVVLPAALISSVTRSIDALLFLTLRRNVLLSKLKTGDLKLVILLNLCYFLLVLSSD